MFNFFKKKKTKEEETEEQEKKMQIAREIRIKEEEKLKEFLDGKESYKILSYSFLLTDGTRQIDKILPLKRWEDVAYALNILEKEYDNIKEGGITLLIKDDKPSYDGDEIASLEIHIKYGYMRPYMKYRAEGKVNAEEWKIYFDINASPMNALEFDMEEVGMEELTQDISLVKKLFKEFYETGDVSEKYMF